MAVGGDWKRGSVMRNSFSTVPRESSSVRNCGTSPQNVNRHPGAAMRRISSRPAVLEPFMEIGESRRQMFCTEWSASVVVDGRGGPPATGPVTKSSNPR